MEGHKWTSTFSQRRQFYYNAYFENMTSWYTREESKHATSFVFAYLQIYPQEILGKC